MHESVMIKFHNDMFFCLRPSHDQSDSWIFLQYNLTFCVRMRADIELKGTGNVRAPL